jgi:hypothetical protein
MGDHAHQMVRGCAAERIIRSRVAEHQVKIRSRDQLRGEARAGDHDESGGPRRERGGFCDADRRTSHGRLELWLLDHTRLRMANAPLRASTLGSVAARDRSSAGPRSRDSFGATCRARSRAAGIDCRSRF